MFVFVTILFFIWKGEQLDTEKQITEALVLLELEGGANLTDANILNKAYKKKALKLHPDKGGTHEQFLALCEAYHLILTWIQNKEAVDNHIEKTSKKKVDITPSVADSLANLYIIIADVEKKLVDCESGTIAKKQLKASLDHIALTLRGNILDQSPYDAAELLRQHANALNDSINNIHRGPSPELTALIASVMVGVFTLLIALSAGITISSGLMAIPLIGTLAFSGFCFFTAVDADKQRTRLQKEMGAIVTAIDQLAAVILKEINSDSEVMQPIQGTSLGC
ncbi:MAG: hypothetical protein CK426_09375 [Legionella sp.]|nr:MAG: hypothetical protein CK426_09375 [Legionella sp.]